jgi:hypothetical protein
MTRAPAALASCNANSATPPVPRTSTSLSGPTPPARSAFHAVVAAMGRVAASVSVKPAGGRASQCGRASMWSRATPGSGPPSCVARSAGVMRPAIHSGM